ncbi:hypothetical protein E3P81_02480 [Wallemia ichthyophaga]|nr:hypothetical protein E3P97_02488 [Wallemia ichthyophaga]TIB31574.1 hypothetical protein E3P85_02204 [Wallemia ichthyophaga]TIB45973.1 hypothetical protein E3P82_02480 [Wallemia ichthyophaga]TIB49504.1 hypothetical protein E3P81_02480 [Wallemia ichthyophaga]TIB52658.1 hypothetical protein E3P80_02481 [Wallemia ichthyophaga]
MNSRRSCLLSWCESNGVDLDGRLDISDEKILSNDFILKDSVVARIPKDSLLTLKTSTISTQLSQIPLTHVVALSFALVFEIQSANQSKWHLYIQSLPLKPPDIASLWPLTPEMAGTELCKRYSMLNSHQGIRGRQTKQKLKDTFDAHASTLNITSTFEAFLYAYAITSSRLFQVDTHHQVGLVPVADLFNHLEEPTVAIESDLVVCDCCGWLNGCIQSPNTDYLTTPPQTLDIVTTHTTQPTEELFNSYGDSLDNVDLAIEYGFVLEANDSDRVTFDAIPPIYTVQTLQDDDQDLFVAHPDAFIDSQARVSLGLFGVCDTDVLNLIVLAYQQSETITDGYLRQLIQQLLQRIDERLGEYPPQVDTKAANPLLMQMRNDELGLLQTAKMRFDGLL